jgi:hypothetical protein
MTFYVMDTDLLTLYQHGHASVVQRAGTHQPGEVATTIISVQEQLGRVLPGLPSLQATLAAF